MSFNKSVPPSYFGTKPSIKIKVVGFGQGGGKIADIFASFTESGNGRKIYDVFALNSNDGDFASLENIPKVNQVSLGLGGLGKHPQRASLMFKTKPELKSKLREFVQNVNYNADGSIDDMHLYIATLGGGTGTATIVEAARLHQELYAEKIRTVINIERQKLKEQYEAGEIDEDDVRFAIDDMQSVLASQRPRIGLILVTPPHNEGGEILRQSSNFVEKAWSMMMNDSQSPLSFIHFPDNQFFHKEFENLGVDIQEKYGSVNDWANTQIAMAFHGIFSAVSSDSADVILDATELKRLLLEDKGSLTLAYSSKRITEELSYNEVLTHYEEIVGTNIHQYAIPLKVVGDDGETYARKYTNLGVITVLDMAAHRIQGETASAQALSMLKDKVNVVGTIFPSFLRTANRQAITTYLVYKFNTLPPQIEDMVNEYKEIAEATNNERSIEVTLEKLDSGMNFNKGTKTNVFDSLFGEEEKPKPKREFSDLHSELASIFGDNTK